MMGFIGHDRIHGEPTTVAGQWPPWPRRPMPHTVKDVLLFLTNMSGWSEDAERRMRRSHTYTSRHEE